MKIKFTIGTRIRSIYYDVMQGHLALDRAPKLFREALEKPDMPTIELIKVLLKYNVPPDMFFRNEDITASAELDQSMGGKHVRFDEDTTHADLPLSSPAAPLPGSTQSLDHKPVIQIHPLKIQYLW